MFQVIDNLVHSITQLSTCGNCMLLVARHTRPVIRIVPSFSRPCNLRVLTLSTVIVIAALVTVSPLSLSSAGCSINRISLFPVQATEVSKERQSGTFHAIHPHSSIITGIICSSLLWLHRHTLQLPSNFRPAASSHPYRQLITTSWGSTTFSPIYLEVDQIIIIIHFKISY